MIVCAKVTDEAEAGLSTNAGKSGTYKHNGMKVPEDDYPGGSRAVTNCALHYGGPALCPTTRQACHTVALDRSGL